MLKSVTSPSRSRKRTRIALALATTAVVAAGTTAAQAGGWFQPAPSHDFVANGDTYSGHGTVTGNVLRNDFGASAVVRQTAPADGTATVNPDGSFSYTPKAGFHGTD